jgi:hypothetical protein
MDRRTAALTSVLLCAAAITGTALADTIYRRDTVGDAPTGAVDVVSTSRVAWLDDGRPQLRISMRFAAPNTSIFGGLIRIDTDRDGDGDAKISYSHWDNGDDPDSCAVRVDGKLRFGHADASPDVQRFRCTIPRAWLPGIGPVGWAILHRDGNTGEMADRAPDLGWYR